MTSLSSFVCSQRWWYQPAADVAECSALWAVWSDQGLEVDGFSSVDGLEVQHHHLESDAGRNRNPVEVTEEADHTGAFWIPCSGLVSEAESPTGSYSPGGR